MKRIVLPLREDLEGVEPYGAPQLDVDVCLNVNENPYEPSPEVIESIGRAVTEVAASLNRYPDREFMGLREDLARYLEKESGVALAPEQVWAANGSNEIMVHILQAFGGPGRIVTSFDPTYSMYPEYARVTFSDYRSGRRGGDFTLDPLSVVARLLTDRPSVLLLASPNNPTGTALPVEDIETILKAAEQTGPQREDGEKTATVVVVDEAYAEFRRSGVASALTLLERYPHLVVSRTMSKAFGMAGARLGYMAASSEIVDMLRCVRLPYHLSAVTQATARAALSHSDELMKQVEDIRQRRDKLAQWLVEQGYQIASSDANFVMFGYLDDRGGIWRGLLERGVLIREVGPPGWLRVSVGTERETEKFKQALLEVSRP